MTAVALLLGAPAGAVAHTHLAGLAPEPEKVLTEAPDAVSLTFSEPVDVVTHATGLRVAGAPAAVQVVRRSGGRRVLLRPRVPLRPGAVDVRFRVLSRDGHVLKGRYTFFVERDIVGGALLAAGGGLETGGAEAGPQRTAGAVHGVHHLLLVLALGLALVGPAVLGAAGAALPVGLLRGLCLLGAVAAVVTAMATWAAAEGGSWSLSAAADTDAGQGWLLRAGLWLVAALLAGQALAAGGALAGVALSLALSGHAASHGGAVSVVLDTVHLLAAGAWLGGLAVLAVFARSAAGAAAYGRIALVAFAALVVTGVAHGLLRSGGIGGSPYGTLVLVKLGVATAIAAIAGWAAWRGAPLRAGRLGAELALGAAALTLAAILVETAPPS